MSELGATASTFVRLEKDSGRPQVPGKRITNSTEDAGVAPLPADKVGVSLSRVAYDAVLRQILNGTLRGNDVVQEGKLAADLGLSRTPMREAIGKLEGEGFLVRNGRTLMVQELTLADYLEIVHMRRCLESEAIAIAIESVGKPDFTEDFLRGLRDEFEALPLDAGQEAYWHIDTRLHGAILRASHSKLLYNYVLSLRQRTLLFGSDRQQARLEVGRNEHLAIIDALLARDKEAAVAAMRRHLDNIRDDALRSLWQFG
ncbi:MAG: GntR family transcriptional regulator [Rhodovulum sulfidophilum]|uniref:GntR family transcriptional regulator n=1 Tax=Rhodovulum sulfidophilum TaxID=35806 RepID=A0A2W5N554_RHOSU|nr:MAG: GntR family transcriptional regulator [Rhodovulum sulfidophilum]